jgi:hypothetical protein
MHEYDLERLNARSFEQLVQALGLAVLGSQLEIFGDGPDGGREATFEGAVKYPEGKKQWHGFGIVQAKFRQHPDNSAKKNADWAIDQLKGELKKYKPYGVKARTRNDATRSCPDYYIFATNIVLSATKKTGGKDRVREILKTFKRTHGLKDFAVWDGGQIRRYLDLFAGIRQTYAAWLVPGDVLAYIIKALSPARADFLITVRRYLESELLDDQFARLTQGGYTEAKSIPLCAVFVDLPIDLQASARDPRSAQLLISRALTDGRKAEESNPACLEVLFEEGRQILKPSLNGHRLESSQRGRFVLIGGPGQGKTTVGQFACQLLRASLLRATGENFSPEVTQALARIEEDSAGLPSLTVRRYPLRIDLKQLASYLAATPEESQGTLLQYLVKRISARTNCVVTHEDFRLWLRGYPWLLVLDGLDEVPASSNRQQVMQCIRDFISVEAHSLDADLLVLATTRPQGYSDEFSPSIYWHLALAPLNSAQSLRYGSRLAIARHPGQPTRVEELKGALARATKNDATVRLMQSPLQVTIMLALIEGGGEPPEQRWKLFRDYYDVIYRREKERGTSFSSILGAYEPDIHWVHHRAGWLLQQRNAAIGRTDARLTHTNFEELVDERLRNVGHVDPSARRALVKQIRLAATDRLVFLVGNTEDEIGFEIRSLQEFMASEHIFDGGESCVQETIHAIAPFSYWRNVLLFAAGRIFFERQVLIDSVVAVCVQMNDSPFDDSQRIVLPGSRFALALLRDGAARNHPGWTRALARIASRLLHAQDPGAAETLAEVYSGHAEEILRDELDRNLFGASPHSPAYLNNLHLCLLLAMSGAKAWATDLLLKRFPWDGEDFFDLLTRITPVPSTLPEILLDKAVLECECATPIGYPWLLGRGDRLGSGILHQLDQFSRHLYRSSDDHWLLKTKDKAELRVMVQGEPCLRNWASFQYSGPLRHSRQPRWRMAREISMFAQAGSLSGLINVLKLMAEIHSEGKHVPTDWLYPWQINVAIGAHKAGRTWNEIIAAADRGDYGTEKEWARWQELGKKGVDLSIFRSESDLRLSDEELGPILRHASWFSLHIGTVTRQFFMAAIEEIRENIPLANARKLAELCWESLQGGLSKESFTIDEIRELISCCDAKKLPISTLVLAAILALREPHADRLALLTAAGKLDIETDWIPNWQSQRAQCEDGATAVINALAESTDRSSTLYALSRLPPLDSLRLIRNQDLDFLRRQEGRYQIAADALSIKSLRWMADESAAIVAQVARLQASDQQLLDGLFAFIEETNKNGSSVEAFLAHLIQSDKAPISKRKRSGAAALLLRLVERRTAPTVLPDPDRKLEKRIEG